MKATIISSKYLKGIVENDYAVLEEIYQKSLPEIIKYVKRNSGTEEDAKDVFQEGILAIFNKAKTGDLQLTTTFHAFLFMVSKRIWLKKLRKKGNKEVTFEESAVFSFEEDYDEQFIKTKKWRLFNEKFQQLAEECRKVLQLSFNGRSGKDIAEVMGYTVEYVKRKKYKCKNNLANLIKKDRIYSELTT